MELAPLPRLMAPSQLLALGTRSQGQDKLLCRRPSFVLLLCTSSAGVTVCRRTEPLFLFQLRLALRPLLQSRGLLLQLLFQPRSLFR